MKPICFKHIVHAQMCDLAKLCHKMMLCSLSNKATAVLYLLHHAILQLRTAEHR